MGRSAPKIKYSPNSRCRPSSCLLAVLAMFLEDRNISSMRRSVSSRDQTLRREFKIQRAAEYF